MHMIMTFAQETNPWLLPSMQECELQRMLIEGAVKTLALRDLSFLLPYKAEEPRPIQVYLVFMALCWAPQKKMPIHVMHVCYNVH